MRKLLTTVALLAAMATSANATQISSFSQTSGTNTVVATDDGTTTTLSIVNATTNVSQLFGNPAFSGVEFNLSATSTDAAVTFLGAIIQHFSGTFCITTGPGCTGTNLLSGTFTDAAFGAGGGTGLVLNASDPPDSLVLTSDVIAAASLGDPSSLNFGFSNLTPALHIDGATIAAFTASFAGTVSATTVEVFEPSSIMLLGLGVLGIAFLKRRDLI